MGAIRPKGKLKDARFLRAGRPATMDFRGGISNREEEAEQEQPPAGGPGNQGGQPAAGQPARGPEEPEAGQPARGPEEPEAQIPREENQPRPEAEYEGGEQFVPLRGLPNFRFVVQPGAGSQSNFTTSKHIEDLTMDMSQTQKSDSQGP